MAALTPPLPRFDARRTIVIALVVATLGAAGVAVGLWLAPTRTLHAYLVAFTFAASVTVGALVFQLVGYATNARWMSVTRGLTGAVALGVVPLGLLFLPLALGAAWIYSWADPHAIAAAPADVQALLLHKRPFLNVPFFAIRAVVYVAIWATAALVLHHWSRRRERASESRIHGEDERSAETRLGRERSFASAMLPLVGLALTFAAFDWLMSLEPTWVSSIFGIYYFAGGFLAGVASVAILAWASLRRRLALGALTPNHFHALGRLLLAFTIFWAYVAYFQVFLVQIADKPSEAAFYVHRLGGSWTAYVRCLAAGHFAVPLLLLLPRAPKLRPGYVASVGAWLLLMHYLDLYWLVLPMIDPRGFAPRPVDLAALALVAGLTVAFGAFCRHGAPVVPLADPFLPEGLGYASST